MRIKKKAFTPKSWLFFPPTGEILGKDFDCTFEEVAAAEQVTEIADVFHELARKVLATRRKNKQSLLERMLGNKRSKSDSKYA